MAQLHFPEPTTPTYISSSVAFSLGLRPLAGETPAFETRPGGKVSLVTSDSMWKNIAPIDWLFFSDTGKEIDEPGLLQTCARSSGVVAMGDMVEPFLDANGLSDLYAAWVHHL